MMERGDFLLPLCNIALGAIMFIFFDNGPIYDWCRRGWLPARAVVAAAFWPIALFLQWRHDR